MNQSLVLDFAGVIQSVVDAGLMVSTVTFKAPPTTLDATGAPSGPYTNVSGLVAIQCMDAPDKPGANTLSAWEKDNPAEVDSFARRHLLLDGYYALLSPATNWGDVGWKAEVTNTLTGEQQFYDVHGAEADSHQSQTRVCLQRATV
jgi:hypothetical protein